jgi:hypothetical protein
VDLVSKAVWTVNGERLKIYLDGKEKNVTTIFLFTSHVTTSLDCIDSKLYITVSMDSIFIFDKNQHTYYCVKDKRKSILSMTLVTSHIF